MEFINISFLWHYILLIYLMNQTEDSFNLLNCTYVTPMFSIYIVKIFKWLVFALN